LDGWRQQDNIIYILISLLTTTCVLQNTNKTRKKQTVKQMLNSQW